MTYSELYFPKKTNHIFLLILGGLSLIALFFTVKIKLPAEIKQISKKDLIRYEMVNITSSHVGIFWETEKTEESWIEFQGTKIYDDRDVAGSSQKHTYHYISLRELKENTDYSFQILSREGIYTKVDSSVLRFKTPKNEIARSGMKPAYGKILLPNGKPAQDVFALVKIQDKYPLLAISKDTGEWLVSLNTLVDKKTQRITSDLLEGAKVNIEYISEKNKSSYMTTTISRITPIASTVIMGNNYNLLAQGDVLSASTDNGEVQKLVLTIVYPRENSIIPAGRPLFKGTGLPDSDIFIFINSKPQNAYRTKVDKKGEWKVLPTVSISPGSYLASITSQDEKGTKITIKRNFMIAKSGEQVLGEATGTATITPTQPVSPTSVVLSPTPTGIIIPTLIPTSSYISPYPTALPTSSNPPTTGGNISHLFIASIAFIVLGLGFMLVF